MRRLDDITSYDPSTLTFDPRWEEYDCHFLHPEDGEPMFGKVMHVIATAPNGARFAMHIGSSEPRTIYLPGIEDPIVEYTHNWEEITENAERVTAHLNAVARPKLRPHVWISAGAVYGSEAYVKLDLEGTLDVSYAD